MNRATRRAAARHKPRQAPQYLNSTMRGRYEGKDLQYRGRP